MAVRLTVRLFFLLKFSLARALITLLVALRLFLKLTLTRVVVTGPILNSGTKTKTAVRSLIIHRF